MLDVQDLDSRIDLLKHQLASLPEHAELKALSASRQTIDNDAKDLGVKVDDLVREQKKADADVEQVKARRRRDQERMDQGLVTNPKDLEHLSHELVSLDRRISELEDAELDVMEALETAQSDLSGLRSQLEAIDDKGAALTQSRDKRAAEIHAEIAAATAERTASVAGLPDDLVALYVKLREQKDGVGAAPLRQRRCEGCSMQLNPSDLGIIKAKPSDEVVRCEECSRILVRTSESGL